MTAKSRKPRPELERHNHRVLAIAALLVIVVLVVLFHGDGDRHETLDSPQSIPGVPEDAGDAVVTEQPGVLIAPETAIDSLHYFLDRIGDPAFTETYGDGFVWYTAAEELGLIGLPAIPHLIGRLDTDDEYERTQVFYALRLAAQHDNVRALTGGEYVDHVPDAFPPPEVHEELVAAWREWYDRCVAPNE